MILFLLLIIFGLGFLDVARKVYAPTISAFSLSFGMTALLGIIFLLIGWITNSLQAITPFAFWLGLASGVVGTIANVVFVISLKTTPLSIAGPLLSLSALWTALGNWGLSGIPPDYSLLIGMSFIFFGSITLMLEGFHEQLNLKGLLLAVLASFCWGSQTVMDPFGLAQVGVWSWGTLLCLPITLLSIPLVVRKSFGGLPSLKPTLILTLCCGVGVITQLYAVQVMPSAIVETVKRGGLLIFALVVGRAIFKESITRGKVVALLLLMTGVMVAAPD